MMKKFKVTFWESIVSTHIIEAESEDDLFELRGNHNRYKWQCTECTIEECEEMEEEPLRS